MTDDCRECKQPLLEIGNRGEHLTGCMACNIWWSQEGKKVVRLSAEDLHASHTLRSWQQLGNASVSVRGGAREENLSVKRDLRLSLWRVSCAGVGPRAVGFP